MLKSVIASFVIMAVSSAAHAHISTTTTPSTAEQFVNAVANPVRDRGLSRWSEQTQICVGVANLATTPAQSIADRVSDIAAELGLKIAAPGCQPNLLVIASGDGNADAARFVNRAQSANLTPDHFGAHHGHRALQQHFVASSAPIRWWQTGTVTTAYGEIIGNRNDNNISGRQIGSRLSTEWQDNLNYTVIIMEPAKLERLNTTQLADYIAFVSLSQIKPDAVTSYLNTILNVTNDASAAQHLTAWDWAYLRGLYSAERRGKATSAARAEVASHIERTLSR